LSDIILESGDDIKRITVNVAKGQLTFKAT